MVVTHNKSYSLTAEIEVPDSGATGVIVAIGASFTAVTFIVSVAELEFPVPVFVATTVTLRGPVGVSLVLLYCTPCSIVCQAEVSSLLPDNVKTPVTEL